MRRVAVAAALLAALTGCSSSGSHSSTHSSTPKPSPTTYKSPPATLPVPQPGVTMATGPAPWPAPVFFNNGALSAGYVAAAGLPYAEEMLSVHYHAHLDVVINGKAVPVPAYIGFVAKGRNAIGLAPLHTHLPDGIIHIENSVPATFLLGQFFIEWGVRLTSTCVGGYCSDSGHELAVFVDGQRYSGDPNKIVLAKHQEIAIEYAATGKLPTPPASYHFPSGE